MPTISAKFFSATLSDTCEFNNGRVYVLSGAYLVDEPSFKADDGTVELQFDGIKGSWQ